MILDELDITHIGAISFGVVSALHNVKLPHVDVIMLDNYIYLLNLKLGIKQLDSNKW